MNRETLKHVLIYGASGGVLIIVLKMIEIRFLIIEHSFEIYGALIAALFAAVGIWLGLKLTRKEEVVLVKEVVKEVPVPLSPSEPFAVNEEQQRQLGITKRELEILELIAQGLSNREIAGKLFVSENTVKTHSSRLFDKLSAKRRTQAVQIAKEIGLIP
jgi:ATP/maltotriose-dependent transcriptional regulator MalT